MSLHQHPESIINIDTDALPSDQRKQIELDPKLRAAIGLREIAIALSNAGFEVYADTWKLLFREPARTGFLVWLQGKILEFRIIALDSDSYTIRPTYWTKKGPQPLIGDKRAIMRFVAQHYPNRPLTLFQIAPRKTVA